MVQTIEIDGEVYARLQEAAEPFIDTPNTVLRRLLNLDRADVSSDGRVAAAAATPNGPTGRVNGTASKRSSAKGRGKSDKKSRTRVPAGSILSEEEYEIPLLKSLADAGGSAPAKEIVEAVGRLVGPRLTDLDREPLASGGIRWQNRIQFVRLRMIDRGLMTKETPRGVWGITEAGRKHVAANQ